jgi:pyrroloquinoline-quinone synthase
MSDILNLLNAKIEAKHLLKHPFYAAWSNGELSLEDLRFYACQYFAHVRAFPTYLSEMHSRCGDLESRRAIAANLADEEAFEPTHPELWLRFAEGLSVSRERVINASTRPGFTFLVNTYREIARMDTSLAAAGLYCYEKQILLLPAPKFRAWNSAMGSTTPKRFAIFASTNRPMWSTPPNGKLSSSAARPTRIKRARSRMRPSTPYGPPWAR